MTARMMRINYTLLCVWKYSPSSNQGILDSVLGVQGRYIAVKKCLGFDEDAAMKELTIDVARPSLLLWQDGTLGLSSSGAKGAAEHLQNESFK